MARPEEYYRSPSPEELQRYVNNKLRPPVDPVKLHIELMVGERRNALKTPITGDMSLVLRYKAQEGSVTSMGDEGEVLSVLQLQGANGRTGYRTATGIQVVRLFASQIKEIAYHPEASFRELSMPEICRIEGMEDAQSHMAQGRYEALVMELGLKYSLRERRFVRKLK